ncbi:MAG: SsrA-binding protein SmpB [Candidatus Marinimicrobia bacterium]|nr:SsrA-binding protein SmpB [Candidatus Neomarinimicrobiota bacterium]MCF7829667.1 SsrA-binding protein SmpB [Candidatus Neomarinimicrobiota bacterium]MCF7879827.1 SsrA-binding protein SmpB [Candidatus Neomarinimicrobiota bacterium]
MAEDNIKIISRNRKARHDYTIHETYEAGIALRGSEVKSLRDGKASLSEAYARVIDGEVFLIGSYIKPYKHTGEHDRPDPRRDRKLLLHKREIRQLKKQTDIRGNTIVPLSMYFRDGYAKVEIGIGTGKRKFDKRQDMKERDARREMDRAMKKYN